MIWELLTVNYVWKNITTNNGIANSYDCLVDMSTTAPLGGGKDEESEKKDEMDDDTMFTTLGEEDKSKLSVAPRWATRVFAADCLCRVIMLCENANKAHFDLALARSAKLKNPKSKHEYLQFFFVLL